jgi:hypothetical protein
MSVPFISKERRHAGLIKARLCKAQRAQVKQSIKNGLADFNSFFLEDCYCSDIIANMKLFDKVKSIPGIGDIKAQKILKNLCISQRKTVKGLSKKQIENFKKYFKIN